MPHYTHRLVGPLFAAVFFAASGCATKRDPNTVPAPDSPPVATKRATPAPVAPVRLGIFRLSPGDTVDAEYTREVSARVKMSDNTANAKLRVHAYFRSIANYSVVAVEDGSLTEYTEEIRQDRTRGRMVGKSDSGESVDRDKSWEPNELEGVTIRHKKGIKLWTRTAEGEEEPDDSVVEEIESHGSNLSIEELFPNEPIAPGHRWQANPNVLRVLLGLNKDDLVTTEMEFVGEEEVNGERCAVLHIQLSCDGSSLDETTEGHLEGEGKIYCSLASGILLRAHLEGKIHGNTSDSDEAKKGEFEGTFTIDMEARVRRKGEFRRDSQVES